MSELHVFKNDVIDWVVAESVEDAKLAHDQYMKDIGADPYGADLYEADELEWKAEPDDKVLSITDDDEGCRIEKTCATWAREKGRGFLCSTEF